MAYTLEDVKKRISSGKYNLSESDMKLAEKNPDAVMSIINYKDDYNKAATDEARALANMGAEKIRKTYGGYTGGTDGASFYLNDPTPASFDGGSRPQYTSQWGDSIKNAYDKIENYGSFEYNVAAPTYSDKYADKRDELVTAITDRPEFKYNRDDESYKSYAKQYAREGKRATDDTLASAAAQSGGIASSYALTAANQARNYYAAQLADKIPELYENAYNRYLKEYQQKQNDLAAVETVSQNDYDRYLNELSQYNNDRNFAYQQYANDYDRLRNQLSDAQALDSLDYSKYRDEVSDYQNDRDFRYQQLLDTISNSRYNDETEYARAQDKAAYRDYSGLERYGYDLSGQRKQDALTDEYSRLQLGAGYADIGDYDNVDRLGIDSSNLRTDRQKALEQATLDNLLAKTQIANYNRSWADDDYARELNEAQLAANYGDLSKLEALGIDTTEYKKANAGDAVTAGEVLEAYDAYQNGKASADQYNILIKAGLIDQTSAINKAGGNGVSESAEIYAAIEAYNAGKATAEQYDILIKAGLISADGWKGESSEIDSTTGNDAEKTYPQLAGLARYNGSYADVQNKVLTRNEWNILKAQGAKQSNISGYETYDDYLADVMAYQQYLKHGE